MHSDANAGFTLIEVLVALAVVVTAFLAMYGSAQQIVYATTLAQEKTFATWVAHNQLTELRLADQLPQGDRISDTAEMAGLEWRYVIEFQDVDSEYFKQAVVRVSYADEPELVIARALAVLPVANGSGNTGKRNSGDELRTSATPSGDSGSEADLDGDGIPDGGLTIDQSDNRETITQ